MSRAPIEETNEIAVVKKFLLDMKFQHFTPDFLEGLSILIHKSSKAMNLIMNDEYAELAATTSKAENVRAKFGYYIPKNYDDVRRSILDTYGYDIGEHYEGIKAFIEKTGIAYSLYARK